MDEDQVINFYSERAAYGEFSNYFDFPVVIDGKEWPTTEVRLRWCARIPFKLHTSMDSSVALLPGYEIRRAGR